MIHIQSYATKPSIYRKSALQNKTNKPALLVDTYEWTVMPHDRTTGVIDCL